MPVDAETEQAEEQAADEAAEQADDSAAEPAEATETTDEDAAAPVEPDKPKRRINWSRVFAYRGAARPRAAAGRRPRVS